MDVLVNLVIFIASGLIVWFLAGSLIDAVDRMARRLHRSGFSVAFIVLGLLTSISEISVATNATLSGVPAVSVGNLIGATFVLLFLVIPIFAIAGNGVELRHAISRRNLFLALLVAALPALLVIDGNVTRAEGIIALLSYATVAYALHRQRTTLPVDPLPEAYKGKRAMWQDLARIVLGAAGIFIAAHFLVGQSVYFAELLTVPVSLIGLIVLSIGTNIPEIVIAARAIRGKHKDIAFGNYLGSMAMNVPIFGFMGLFAGTFFLEASEFYVTTILMLIGLPLLFVFARTKSILSRREGFILLIFYVLFVMVQLGNLVRFATS